MGQGNFLKINRRFFLGQGVASVFTAFGLMGLSTALQSCTSLDEYLIEDQFDYDQDVVIIGGGLTGLFAAYELKKNKIPFKLFDASTRFGGQIQTEDKSEWGAFQFKKSDELLLGLARELNLEITSIDKKNWIFQNGASSLTSELIDLVQGIMPKRQLRQGYKLTSIRKFGIRHQLVFSNADRDRIYYAKKVIIALPSFALKNIKGLETINSETQHLDQFLDQAEFLVVQRIIIPSKTVNTNYKSKNKIQIQKLESEFKQSALQLNQELKANISFIEHDNLLYITVRCSENHPIRYLENLQNFTHRFTSAEFQLDNESMKDWGAIELSQLAQQSIGFDFELSTSQKIPVLSDSSYLQIVTDAMIAPEQDKSYLEQLLKLVKSRVNVFKADI